MQFPKQAFLKVSTDLKALDQVLNWFDELNLLPMPKQDWTLCKLALAEGFTNAVNHAHHNLPSEVPIDVQLTLSLTNLEIRIWDYGEPFDLEAYIADLDRIISDDRVLGNGRGIPILCKIADYLSYTRTENNRNCLLIVRTYAPLQTNYEK